jgi:hypothetical protein
VTVKTFGRVRSTFNGPQRLEPLAPAPFVLGEEHAAELCQRVGADIVERPEEAFAILNGERNNLGAECERPGQKGARRLVYECDESRTSSSGIRSPARYTEVKLPHSQQGSARQLGGRRRQPQDDGPLAQRRGSPQFPRVGRSRPASRPTVKIYASRSNSDRGARVRGGWTELGWRQGRASVRPLP